MQRRTIYGIALIATVVIGAWFYFAPYIATYNMMRAAKTNDSETLSNYINFPLLRESLKANFNAMLVAEVAKSGKDDPFETFGAILAAAIINPMIDALVTPESLSMMMQGNKPNLAERKLEAEGKPKESSETEMSMGYENFNKFIVSVKKKGDNNSPIVFVLHREGFLNWKLASLRLPLKANGS